MMCYLENNKIKLVIGTSLTGHLVFRPMTPHPLFEGHVAGVCK
jgi:hypothetical protein